MTFSLNIFVLVSFSALFISISPALAQDNGTAAATVAARDGINPNDSQLAEANQIAPSANATPAEVNRSLPMLFIVGDSTVHNSAPGLLGWGDVLGKFFDPNRIIVENHAKPGRSSRTFQTQGWWAQILSAARPGDFVIIQLGDNDAGPLDDTNRARGSLPGLGDESRTIYNPVQHRNEVVHTFGWYMRKYITDARVKGMTPIICSPVPHVPKAMVKAGEVETVNYVKWSRQVAKQEHVFFIPLNQLVLANYVEMSPKEVRAKYFTSHDMTHSNPAGAALNASEVVHGIRLMRDCRLNTYLVTNPATPPSS